MNKCLNCKLRPKKTSHFNCKYCDKCRNDLLKKPKTNMTIGQTKEAKKYIGKMPRNKIAEKIGVSVSSLKRGFPGTRFAFFNRYARDPKLVNAVCRYYEKHGKIKTQEKFPEIKVRSLIEHYKNFEPRQIRWTDDQKIELIKMSCFIPFKSQYKYFNRPRAKEGSIWSAWAKTLKLSRTSIHGMALWNARHLMEGIYNDNVYIKTPGGYKLVLWVELERYLASWLPMEIKDAIKALAKFQRLLFGENVKKEIKKMIKERT